MILDVRALGRRLYAYFVLDEGSTRPAAILRIGIVLLLWARFGEELVLYKRADWVWNLTSVSFFFSTLLLLFGIKTALAKWWVALSSAALIVALGHFRDFEGYRHHHVHLLVAAAVLLALTPCGRSYSVDRCLALRRGHVEPERGPLWGQRLIALQVSAVYFFGGVDKLNWPFLSGVRMQHHFQAYYVGSDLPDFVGFDALFMIIGAGSTALELALAIGLFFRRWQLPLVVLGILFHLAIYMTLPVLTFSATICFLYLAFLDPDAVHRVIDELSRPQASAGSRTQMRPTNAMFEQRGSVPPQSDASVHSPEQ